MNKDEALKMAIEALKDSLTRQDVAINACEEALEQRTNNLDATVFVYRNKETMQIKCEYVNKAMALEDDNGWEHLATLEPRAWIEHTYTVRERERMKAYEQRLQDAIDTLAATICLDMSEDTMDSINVALNALRNELENTDIAFRELELRLAEINGGVK